MPGVTQTGSSLVASTSTAPTPPTTLSVASTTAAPAVRTTVVAAGDVCVSDGYRVRVPAGWVTNRERDPDLSCRVFDRPEFIKLPIRADGSFTLEGIDELSTTLGVYVKWERGLNFDVTLKLLAAGFGQTLSGDPVSGTLTSSAPGFIGKRIANGLRADLRAYDLVFVAAEGSGMEQPGAVRRVFMIEHPRGGLITVTTGTDPPRNLKDLEAAEDFIVGSLGPNP